MKRFFILGLILTQFFGVVPAFAQTERGTKAAPAANGREQPPLKELNLTEEQQGAIKRIKANYINKVIHLRSELAAKQLEFKSLIGDPTSSEEAIRTRGRELEAINSQIMREMIGFELEVRKTLTPEQLRTWCSNMDAMQKRWGKYP